VSIYDHGNIWLNLSVFGGIFTHFHHQSDHLNGGNDHYLICIEKLGKEFLSSN
jgi:hypothetical protein